MSLLELKSVSKNFGEVVAVDSVSCSVDRGEIVGFLGPNGAGKSTTMRMITQFLEPDSGAILFDGSPVSADSVEIKKRVGYLPENNPLYKDMIVAEYLDFVADLRGIDHNRRSAVDDAVDSTGLESVFYRPIGDLSKGYRQRVGLAQAILHRPDLLILDEPSEGLDPNQRVGIRALISELGRDHTVILSTHVLSEAQSSCSRLLIINQGKIAADGPVDDLVSRALGTVKITVEASGDGIEAGLGEVEGALDVAVTSRRDDRTTVEITAAAATDLRPTIFNLAKSKDWILYELHQDAGSLEDLFRQITSEEVEA
jgi:ABC-2 type transport system ATP-binding protein